MNLRYLEEEKRPFDLMIYAVRRRLPGNNFDKEQIRVQLQLLDANFDVVTICSDGYLSRERVLSVIQPGTAVALIQFILVIPATNATSERLFTVRATTSQKLLAHHDAAGTSELSDVAARSQGMNRCSGHESSVVNIIHWRVGASVRHLCSV